MILFRILFRSFPLPPVEASVLKKTTPLEVLIVEPKILQLVTRLFVAPAINLMVLVPVVLLDVVFTIDNESPLIARPFIVTLSAPFKSISGRPEVIAPDTTLALPPLGVILILE